MDTIARVRRAFRVQGWSVKKIVRELHVSRNTVRKILRSDETDFSYERERQPMPRIGPWQGQLEQLLSSNEGKPSRERLTLIRIFEELRALGYEGGYDAVRRYARSWSKDRGASTAEAYVPLYYAPGEAYQFDSHGAIRVKIYCLSLIPVRSFGIHGLSQIAGPDPLPAPVQTHIRSPQ